MRNKKKREKWMLRNGGLLLQKRISYFDGKYSNPMRCFSAKELQKATDNYNLNLVSGFGAHYRWYKGCLEGRVIFVKEYFDYYSSLFADPERVSNGISVAAQVSGHKNALKLLGCCLETQIPTLVFEFPANGNLMDQLTSNPTCFPWKIRLKIANEVASVITYLHTAFPRPIIHRDIHSQQFYLDQDLCAKLSDFILCIAVPEGETQVENEPCMGTSGYGAPEIVSSGVYSEKSDVFGFGLILFNLLTGKTYHELLISIFDVFNDHLKGYSCLDCVKFYTGNRGIDGILDPTILAEGGGAPHHHQFEAVCQLGFQCCAKNAEERPVMLDVAKQLRRIQRGDFIFNEANHTGTSSSNNIGCPKNKIS